MTLRTNSSRLALFACVLVLLTGCKVFDEDLLENGRADVPARPPENTSSPMDSETRVFALKDILVNQTSAVANRIGLDLDGVNTLADDEATGSCVPQPAFEPVDDGPGGIDNALGAQLLGFVGALLPCLQDNIALSMGRGNGTILLWLRGWNGQPDDALVSLAVMTAVDGSPEEPDRIRFPSSADDGTQLVYVAGMEPDGGVPDAGPVAAPPPAWDGADNWYADPNNFDAMDAARPAIEVQTAYVVGGRLVAELPDDFEFSLTELNGSLDVRISDGAFVADLDADGQRITKGFLAGRFATADLLNATPQIGICGAAGAIDGQILAFADIQVLRDSGPDGRCDALSLGIAFSGVAGQFAGLANAPVVRPEPCDPQSPNPPLVLPTLDQCCPSTSFSDCSDPALATKQGWFEELPEAIQFPIPTPDF